MFLLAHMPNCTSSNLRVSLPFWTNAFHWFIATRFQPEKKIFEKGQFLLEQRESSKRPLPLFERMRKQSSYPGLALSGLSIHLQLLILVDYWKNFTILQKVLSMVLGKQILGKEKRVLCIWEQLLNNHLLTVIKIDPNWREVTKRIVCGATIKSRKLFWEQNTIVVAIKKQW